VIRPRQCWYAHRARDVGQRSHALGEPVVTPIAAVHDLLVVVLDQPVVSEAVKRAGPQRDPPGRQLTHLRDQSVAAQWSADQSGEYRVRRSERPRPGIAGLADGDGVQGGVELTAVAVAAAFAAGGLEW
jgi:hypothetical protein